MLHFKPHDGYVGDVIPFFYGGRYHIFYLKAPLEPQRSGVASLLYAHLVSDDLRHWEELPNAIEPEPGSPDADGTWTGSVIECDGTFYLFYTGYHRDGDPFTQTI